MANSNEQNGFDQQGRGAAPQQDSTYVPGVIQEQQVIPSPKPQQDAQQPAQGQADWQQAQPQNQGWQPQNPQRGQQGWQAPQGQGWQMPNGQSWQQPNGQQWQQPQGQNWQQPNREWQQPQNTTQQPQQDNGPRFSGPVRKEGEPSIIMPPWSKQVREYRAAHPIDEPPAITWLSRLGYFAMGLVGGFFGVMAVWLLTSSLSPVKKNEAFWIAWLGLAIQAAFFLIFGFGNGGGGWVGAGSAGGTGTGTGSGGSAFG